MKFTTVLAVAFWAPGLCTAFVVDYSYLSSSINALLSRQSDASPCMIVCSPTSCGGSLCTSARKKRSHLDSPGSILPNASEVAVGLDIDDVAHHGLSKRILQSLTRRQVGNYFLAQDPNVLPANKLCPGFAGGYYNPTFCVQHQFANLPNNGQTLVGTGGGMLVGCSVLTVVSARAVYMCHIWEDLHFLRTQSTDAEARIIRGFQPVLDLIRNGGGPNTPDAAGPALNTNLFNGAQDRTYVFISTPRYYYDLENPNSVEYPDRIGQLITLMQGLLPNAIINQRNYYVKRGDDEYEFAFGGKALFQYDPDADGKGIGTRDWRLWYEDTNQRGSVLGQNVA